MEKMSYGDALEEISNAGYKKVHESAVKIRDSERDFSSTYISQIYKQHINTEFWCNGSDNKTESSKKKKSEKKNIT